MASKDRTDRQPGLYSSNSISTNDGGKCDSLYVITDRSSPTIAYNTRQTRHLTAVIDIESHQYQTALRDKWAPHNNCIICGPRL